MGIFFDSLELGSDPLFFPAAESDGLLVERISCVVADLTSRWRAAQRGRLKTPSLGEEESSWASCSWCRVEAQGLKGRGDGGGHGQALQIEGERQVVLSFRISLETDVHFFFERVDEAAEDCLVGCRIRWVENFDPFFGDGGWDVFLGGREQIVKEDNVPGLHLGYKLEGSKLRLAVELSA